MRYCGTNVRRVQSKLHAYSYCLHVSTYAGSAPNIHPQPPHGRLELFHVWYAICHIHSHVFETVPMHMIFPHHFSCPSIITQEDDEKEDGVELFFLYLFHQLRN